MKAEGKDGSEKQCWKTEHDRTEKEDLCTVRSMCVAAHAAVRACGVSDDPALRVLYRACHAASREGT